MEINDVYVKNTAESLKRKKKQKCTKTTKIKKMANLLLNTFTFKKGKVYNCK